jgi:hypothetical protein
MTTDCSLATANHRPNQTLQSTTSLNTPQPQSPRSDLHAGEPHDTAVPAANAAYHAALATIANIRHTSLADFLK